MPNRSTPTSDLNPHMPLHASVLARFQQNPAHRERVKWLRENRQLWEPLVKDQQLKPEQLRGLAVRAQKEGLYSHHTTTTDIAIGMISVIRFILTLDLPEKDRPRGLSSGGRRRKI